MRSLSRPRELACGSAAPAAQGAALERDVQIDRGREAFRQGAERMAYESIIGGGTNSAVLHFAPTQQARFPRRRTGADRRRCSVPRLCERHHRTYPAGEPSRRSVRPCTRSSTAPSRPIDRASRRRMATHLVAALSIAEGSASLEPAVSAGDTGRVGGGVPVLPARHRPPGRPWSPRRRRHAAPRAALRRQAPFQPTDRPAPTAQGSSRPSNRACTSSPRSSSARRTAVVTTTRWPGTRSIC